MSAPSATYDPEPYDAPETLSPGSVPRPLHIRERDWERMSWAARWKAYRRDMGHTLRPVDDVPLEAAGTYRGGPVATQPCGTYAAYQRHKRAQETPCDDCLEANNRKWRERRINLGLPVRRTEFDLDLVARFVRDEVAWDELSVAERRAAARRMDEAGFSRQAIAERTHLSWANLGRAFEEARAS